MSRTCVWIHDATINSEDVALRSFPDAVVVFVFDIAQITGSRIAYHRLRFIYDGVCELFNGLKHPIKEMRKGDAVTEILAVCQEHGCTQIAVTDHASHLVRATIEALQTKLPVTVLPRLQLAQYADEPRRFSRYWEKVAKQVLGYDPKKQSKFHRR